jgi:hypothetical protein
VIHWLQAIGFTVKISARCGVEVLGERHIFSHTQLSKHMSLRYYQWCVVTYESGYAESKKTQKRGRNALENVQRSEVLRGPQKMF